MRKRWIQILLVLLSLIAATVIGALIFVTSQTGSQWLSRRLDEGLEKESGLSVAFSDIDIHWLPPRLIVRDLQVGDRQKRLQCTIADAEISLAPLPLLRGALRVEELYLGSPECTAELDSAAFDKFFADDGTSAQAEKLDLSQLPNFEVFALSEGNFKIDVRDKETQRLVQIELNGLSLDVTSSEQDKAKRIEVRALLRHMKAGLHTPEEPALQEELRDLEWRMSLSEDGIDFRTLSAEVSGIALRARDVYLPLPLKDEREIKAAFVHVDGPLDVLNRLPLGLPRISGAAGFKGQATVRPTAESPVFSARGSIWLRDGQVDDFVIGDLAATVVASQRGVSFGALKLVSARGEITGEGEVAFDAQQSVFLDLHLRDIELAQLLENVTLDNPWVMLRISGDVKVEGRLNDLALQTQVRLNAQDLRVFDRSWQNPRRDQVLHLKQAGVTGRLHITDKALTAQDLQVRTANSALSVGMKFGFGEQDGWQVGVRSEQTDLADLGEIIGLKIAGQGALETQIISHRYNAPRVRGSLSMSRFALAGLPFHNVRAKVSFDRDILSFSDLQIETPKSRYGTEELRIDLRGKTPRIESRVAIEQAAVEDLLRTFGVDAKPFGAPAGNINGTVEVAWQGTPDSLNITADLAHSGLTLFGEVFGAGSAVFDVDGGDIRIQRFDMRKGPGKLSLSGSIQRDNALNLMLDAGNIAIEDIVFPAVSDLELQGRGHLFAAIEGTLDEPRGVLVLQLRKLRRHEFDIGTAALNCDIVGLGLDCTGDVANARLKVKTGRVDFDRQHFDLKAEVNNMDLAPLFYDAAPKDAASAKVSGQLDLSGTWQGQTDINGDIQLSKVALRYQQFRLHNQAPVHIRVQSSEMQIVRTPFGGEDVALQVEGHVSPQHMNIKLDGDMDLRGAAALAPALRKSSGHLGFQLSVFGPWSQVGIQGTAQIDKASAHIDGLPDPITDINGRIDFNGRKAYFREISARSAGGIIDIDGQVSLSGMEIEDYRFRGFLTHYRVSLMDGLLLRISTAKEGRIITPDPQRQLPHITGDIEVSDFRYTQDIRIIEVSDLALDRLAGKKMRAHTPKIFDRKKDSLTYDIRLHGDRNLLLRNNLVDASLRIDDKEEPLRLVGSNQTYGFLGRVFAQKGSVRFAGKTFDIRDAHVTFRDAMRPDNPEFRVTADVEVRDWRVTVIAEGTVEEYQVRLSASPYLSHEDVAFLLLTGMTRSEHAQNKSQGLSGSLAPILGNVGGGIIPVEVSLYSEYSEKAGTDTTRVALGRRITKDIWVQLAASLGEDRELEGTIDYRINDNFSLSFGYDNTRDSSQVGNFGLDLKFRLEF